jgi:hypothetical protein
VLRDVQHMSFADIEGSINHFGLKAAAGTHFTCFTRAKVHIPAPEEAQETSRSSPDVCSRMLTCAGNLALEDMAGGTFTISNGGVFGSMMSTPIVNQPQSAILGMHARG